MVSKDGAFCNIRKFVGSQLRSTSYRARQADCYKVPLEYSAVSPSLPPSSRCDEEDLSGAEEEPSRPSIPAPPTPPQIPEVIAAPANGDALFQANPLPEHSVQTPLESSDYLGDREGISDSEQPISSLRRSTRQLRRPAHFDDYVTDFHS